ncbi:fimbrial protein [Kluyvera genomosp. 1]|uniref:fimbrial protein n=1 Tax=Kluyvera genomosp. 1 TaxID=2774053 RepID=UPI0006900447|nr:fimbrial protein [Kluyvera genomosp. 1]
MKAQYRIMACVITALVSGVASAAVTTNPGSSAGTQGPGGQVNFTGSITDSSCNVDSGSTNQTVDLGKWAKSYFTGAGTETTKTAFHIKVKDCPDSVAHVAVLFDGKKDSTNSDLLAVDNATGSATGVGIKLYEDDQSEVVKLGSVTKAHNVDAGSKGTEGTADLTFFADYASTGATVTTGAANGVADFNMVYN